MLNECGDVGLQSSSIFGAVTVDRYNQWFPLSSAALWRGVLPWAAAPSGGWWSLSASNGAVSAERLSLFSFSVRADDGNSPDVGTA